MSDFHAWWLVSSDGEKLFAAFTVFVVCSAVGKAFR